MSADNLLRVSPPLTDASFAEIKRRAEKRFLIIDSLHPKVREVVHEFGWEPVRLLMELGVTRPGQLRHIILCCRGAAK